MTEINPTKIFTPGLFAQVGVPSDKQDEFESGAVKSSNEGRGRFDLISPYFLRRLAIKMEAGASKVGERNWEKGIPPERCLNSCLRHLTQYMMGMRDEDHLGAAAFWVQALIHYEEQSKTN